MLKVATVFAKLTVDLFNGRVVLGRKKGIILVV